MNVGSNGSLEMRDYLAWRMAFGVTTPSTNTVVQPEYDDMQAASRRTAPTFPAISGSKRAIRIQAD